MVCRNICDRIYSKIVRQSYYLFGKNTAERAIVISRPFCEYCGLQLRATPVIGEYKAKIRAKKRLVTV